MPTCLPIPHDQITAAMTFRGIAAAHAFQYFDERLNPLASALVYTQ
jgi:hypothetical protein